MISFEPNDDKSYEVMQMKFFNLRRSLKAFGVSSWLLLAAILVAIPATSSTASAQVVLSVAIAPPALPIYAQPICPGDGYIWTPGYWSYSDDGGYFWVPGTWVLAPEVGLLWTPGYWGWGDGVYVWNVGYWGPEVGFYGGINYGFGYVGTGYAGGYWTGGHFFYNTRVNNVNVHVIHNIYQKTVVAHTSHVSFNGGHGGITARPTAEQEKFAHENHTGLTAVQQQHMSAARSDRNQFVSVNHGQPAVAATAKPGEFKGPGVVQAKASASDRLTSTRTETKSSTKPRTESKPATTHELKTQPKPKTEPKPATTHEPKPEAKPRTEPKPATTHEPKTEPKPQPQPKPATTHAPKSEPKPEPKPQTESKPPAPHESKPPAPHESAPQSENRPRTSSSGLTRISANPCAVCVYQTAPDSPDPMAYF
jgi:hypothetical protein